MSEDPVKALQHVVKLAQERERFIDMFASQRRAHESDFETLDRILQERAFIVKLFEMHQIKHAPHDYSYRSSFIEATGELLEKVAVDTVQAAALSLLVDKPGVSAEKSTPEG